ncbi:MAG: hypothetical protein L0Y44_07645 [Phycisphaerales bacterium]|nr:hypothetical protein [Phycisphaerales bacterium]MCI0676680.1 hypothetical protein [Phycisphaerales bacterium]
MIVRAKKSRKVSAKRLTPGQLYPVIGIEADWYRIIDDDGGPYLYEPELFEVVNSREPSDWVIEQGEDGERYAYPRPLNRQYFFEDYHDGDRKIIAVFWRVVNRWLSQTG